MGDKMGTRNLTIVLVNGKVKVAQYGQWDGYPTGVGKTIAKFIQNELDLKTFKKYASQLELATKQMIKDSWIDSGADPNSDRVTFDVADMHSSIYPEFSRDTGAYILGLIQTGLVSHVDNQYSFIKNSLFCEWAYELDLDKQVVKVYKGSQHIGHDKYGPCKVIKTYKFNEFTENAMDALENNLSKDE